MADWNTDELLLAIGFICLGLMYLINKRGKYTPLTRNLMLILTASSISAFLIVIFRFLSFTLR